MQNADVFIKLSDPVVVWLAWKSLAWLRGQRLSLISVVDDACVHHQLW